MKPRMIALALALAACQSLPTRPDPEPGPVSYDVCVYGGTSGGVAAAVEVARAGRSVLLIEPGAHLGGLSSGGLGATDIGNKAAIGGLSREFYQRVKAHYDRPDAWRWQRPDEYRSSRRSAGDDAMWTFEPHVAEGIFEELVSEAGVEVLFGERLDLDGGVAMDGPRVASIRMESGREFAAKVFVDGTYEGDLLALAGVSHRVGREANAEYGETLDGVQVAHAKYHQFAFEVDPYVVPGDPASGLLPGIRPDRIEPDGTGDAGVQAYNFRLCLTDAPENRVPFAQPEGFDAREYELLLRHFDAGATRLPWHRIDMPNKKTDVNNNRAVSTDFIGRNFAYPDAGYEERDAIVDEHRRYTEGLLWVLANHERVPAAVREEVSRWGFCKDEFEGGLSHQLYVREARRMVGELVMTQAHCQGREVAPDAVGLAAYTMDSHNVQRHVVEGVVRNEGDVQVGGFPPYPIGYGAIVPRRDECTNLLAPVALSATHIAFGSIRMEPVFMVLGQSAGTAACLAVEAGVDVQAIDRGLLRERLVERGQVLEWRGADERPAPPPQPLDASLLTGVVVDDAEAELAGSWEASASVGGFVGAGYRHNALGAGTATFRVRAAEAGEHELRLLYTPHANRARAVPVEVRFPGAEPATATVDQTYVASGDYVFATVGRGALAAGGEVVVTVTAPPDAGYVVVDAVQLVRVE